MLYQEAIFPEYDVKKEVKPSEVEVIESTEEITKSTVKTTKLKPSVAKKKK